MASFRFLRPQTNKEVVGGIEMNSYKNTATVRVSQHSNTNFQTTSGKMHFFNLFLIVFAVALVGVAMGKEEDHHEHDHHDHGTSSVHLSQKHKHGVHKFTYDIKHGKHSHTWHGSAYPHGYGGFGA